jgi:SIR2-like domain
LDVAARAVRTSFRSPTEFVTWVRFGLYQSFEFDSHGYPTLRSQSLLRRNKTLRAIVKLCRRTRPGKRGLRAVVNYNLDGLLEMALGSYPFQSFWKPAKTKTETLPIYHVHGYLPLRDPFCDYSPRLGSLSDEIVLTEDQYHREAANPYSWANLVQLGAISRSIGLTIGLSLSDPNLRRLLDAARRAPARPEIYGILQKPEATELDDAGIEEIGSNLEPILELYDGFYRSPLPRPDVTSKKFRNQVKQIWGELERTNFRRQVSVLQEFGVEPIWCRHDDIPCIVDKIVSGAK